MRLRPEVERFAAAMEQKLIDNDHEVHWSRMDLQFLSMRLTQEREELRRAIERKAPVQEVLAEAADVANFAMMIADNYGRAVEAGRGRALHCLVCGEPVERGREHLCARDRA